MRDPAMARWMGTGTAAGDDAELVGAESAAAALAGRPDARLIVVFSNLHYDLAAVLRGINKTTGGVPLIGCSTEGELTHSGPTDHNVVVIALGGPGFEVVTRLVTGLGGRQREAGAEGAHGFADLLTDGTPILMMLMDGLANEQEEVLRGAYGVLGAGVPLVGGCAGDSVNLSQTFLLFNHEVHTDALVTAAIRSQGEFGIGVAHGYQPVGSPLLVTSSDRGRVAEFDDAPALDVFLDRLGAPAEAYTDPEAFARFALAHPLGLNRRSGQEMRFIGGADFTDRTLQCLADVPAGGVAWLSNGDEEALLAAAGTARSDAVAALASPPLGLLAFDCIARRTVLGTAEGLVREVQQLTGGTDEIPVAGFYSRGEIARVRGINGFHNETVVVLAVS